MKSASNLSNQNGSLFQERYGDTVKFYSDGYDDYDKKSGAFFDMIQSMREAKNQICVTGWTLSPEQKFAYAQTNDVIAEISLPELFVECASKGVKINAHIWNNVTPDFKQDTDTFMAFVKKYASIKAKEKNSDVKAEKKRILNNIQIKFSDTPVGYSDHAKMVIVDSKDLYIGGLDLTRDRANIKTWHDCHCRIQKKMDALKASNESPASSVVDDAQELFDARFKLQRTEKEKANMDLSMRLFAQSSIGSHAFAWMDNPYCAAIKRAEAVIVNEIQHKYHSQKKPSEQLLPEKKESMRLLTAIRKNNFDPQGKIRPHFPWNKNTHTQELLSSQIDAIKNANNFIYMENQYFIGPHRSKKTGETIVGANLVIISLLNKIKEKIQHGEAFHFYCQLPFRPEGNQDDILVQTLLRKQWNTMEWFINEINESVQYYNKKFAASASVSDYITFTNVGFCKPGKKKENRYEMKYTHSKLMIVDDDIAFIGSNNCNERSNKGNRDHEVCMRIQAYAEIKDFRQKLMAQQLGLNTVDILKMESEKGGPQSHSFVEAVHAKLDNNLKEMYTAENSQPIGTPWGNIQRTNLERGIKPPHVPQSSPRAVAIAQASSDWAYKFPR